MSLLKREGNNARLRKCVSVASQTNRYTKELRHNDVISFRAEVARCRGGRDFPFPSCFAGPNPRWWHVQPHTLGRR